MVVVRRFEGRTVYLTEGAMAVFTSERQREAEEAARDAERSRWLALAASVGVPSASRAKVEGAVPSARSVDAARTLYVNAAERAAARARREKRWIDLARVRRAQAAAEYAAAGSPVPPPDDVVTLQREGMLALLRSFAAQGSDAELVSAGCCRICRADDGKVFRISQELREPRLPHVGCTKGICACDWWIGVVEKKRRRRRSSKTPAGAGAGSPGAGASPEPGGPGEPGSRVEPGGGAEPSGPSESS